MNVKILNSKAQESGKTELPIQFKEPVRADLIKRAVKTILANNRQAYGAKPEAGKRASAYLSKRRRKYKGTYGIGQSRTPRKVMSRSGTRFHHVGAVAPQTVGGRRAHPPKASKIWTLKINEKENRKAIRSAMSASVIKDVVELRGHKLPSNYPFILSDDVTKVAKTADLVDLLNNLGFSEELERVSQRKVRAGKGKARGRKYKTKTGPLFVVTDMCDLVLAANNIPGCDVVLAKNLNAYLLAPGGNPGRLTLYTESAIKQLDEEKLFTKEYKGTRK